MKRTKWFIPFVFIVSLYLVFNRHSRSNFDNYHSVNWADAAGYYVYLPAALLYSFEGHSFPDKIEQTTGHGFFIDSITGKVHTKYNYGVAILQAPFFITAHLLSYVLGFESNGYSVIYYWLVMIAAVVYASLGMLMLKKYLELYFPAFVVVCSLFILFIGTNLYYYTINSCGYSHVYSFFLFASLFYILPKFFQKPTVPNSLLIGLLLGLISLVRPTNVILVAFVFFYNISGLDELKERFFLFKTYLWRILLLPAAFIMIWLPQFFYWKYLSGNWIHYTYKGESFTNLIAPKILEVLFSTNNGWFAYTPLAFLFIIGIFYMIKDRVKNGVVIAVVLAVITYLFASWWNWWFGCSYGSRSYVEYYALLAIPFTYLLYKVVQTKRIGLLIAFAIFVSVCIYLNLNTVYHYDDCWYGRNWDWKEYMNLLAK